MVFGFGEKKKDLKQIDREGQRQVKRSARDIDKEIRNLERQEKELEQEIKKLAKQNQMASCKTLAKRLVEMRTQKDRLIMSKSSIQGMGSKMTQVKVQGQLAETMGSVSTAMSNINNAIDMKETAKTMQTFARQNEMSNLQEEMMSDALADIFDNDEVEEGSENLVSQVLAELNIETTAGLQEAPTNNVMGNKASESSKIPPTGDAQLDKLLAEL